MLIDSKTNAYIYDLYVAPTWRDRFDQLFLENVKIPKNIQVFCAQCGTGGLALEIAVKISDLGNVVATDEDFECLKIAIAKANTLNISNIRFVHNSEIEQEYTPVYDIAFGDASLLPASYIEPILHSLLDVVVANGKVVLYTITQGSFGEFFSIFWEALYECGLAEELGPLVENLINSYPTIDEIRQLAELLKLENIEIISEKEEFLYESGREFFDSPVISRYWLDSWLKILPKQGDKENVIAAIERIIDRDCLGQAFDISIKAALVIGTKYGQDNVFVS